MATPPPLLVGGQKIITETELVHHGDQADERVADLLSSLLREAAQFARKERYSLDWPTVYVAVDVVGSEGVGPGLRLRVSVGAERKAEGAATVLSRALADAARRNREE